MIHGTTEIVLSSVLFWSITLALIIISCSGVITQVKIIILDCSSQKSPQEGKTR